MHIIGHSELSAIRRPIIVPSPPYDIFVNERGDRDFEARQGVIYTQEGSLLSGSIADATVAIHSIIRARQEPDDEKDFPPIMHYSTYRLITLLAFRDNTPKAPMYQRFQETTRAELNSRPKPK